MACSLPPELADTALLAYLDGTADAPTAAHVAACPHCHARARRLAQLQARLGAALHRIECPSPHELGEYHLQALPLRRSGAIARHVTACPHCRRELAHLRSFLGDAAPAAEPGAPERLRVLAARLVHGNTLALAYARVRGDERAPLVYRAGRVHVTLAVHVETGAGTRQIVGLVSGVAAEGWRVRVVQGEACVAETVVDELGNFAVAGLAAAMYDLVVVGTGRAIRIAQLDTTA